MLLETTQEASAFAFACNLGKCSVLEVELWAILYGVRFTWVRGYRNILIESDSQFAINLLDKGCSPHHLAYALVHRIQQLIGHVPNIHYAHILREAN